MTKSADFARGLVDLLEKEIAPKADEIYQRIRRIGSDPLEGAPSRPNIPSIGQVLKDFIEGKAPLFSLAGASTLIGGTVFAPPKPSGLLGQDLES